MALPVSVPYTFGNTTTQNSLVNLDTNFSTIYTAVNGIGNGTNSLSNAVATATGSTTARTLATRFADQANILDFGADATGATDSTSAIQAAVNTGNAVYVPKGTYAIKNAITFSTPGQTIYGDGRRASIFTITNSGSLAFNLSAIGVFIISSGEEGPEFMDIGMVFTQPDTTVRANLTTYPVAIYAVDQPRFTISNMAIFNATNGINMTGNSGGSFIDLLEMSAYGTGISIDGSMDTVRINRYHFWPFNMSSNQYSIFKTNPTRAFSLGRVDGLFISEFLNLSNLGLYLYVGENGNPEVYVSNSSFDSQNAIEMHAGKLTVVNSYITMENNNTLKGVLYSAVFGGDTFQYNTLQFSNCLFMSAQSSAAFITVENTNTGVLQIDNCQFDCPYITQIYCGANNINTTDILVSNCQFRIANSNFIALKADATTNATNIHFSNNIMDISFPDQSYFNPIFSVASGNKVYLTGNRIGNAGIYVSTFISIAADDYNWVSGNIAPGWVNSFPTPTKGYYLNNLT